MSDQTNDPKQQAPAEPKSPPPSASNPKYAETIERNDKTGTANHQSGDRRTR